MRLITSLSLFIVSLLWSGLHAAPAHAGPMDLNDSTLGGISAQGVTTGGDLTNICSEGSNSICLGTFDLTDNHQFDSSAYKGAIEMSGNVQQNVSSEINVNQTQSAGANGVSVFGNMSLNNSTLSLTNANNATSFIGGF
ncbi:MAG TPA: hypothetical protein VLY45_05565 [Nitrospiria bacterium]|nr:hypothetical protein [Nitrospiria bacterium]